MKIKQFLFVVLSIFAFAASSTQAQTFKNGEPIAFFKNSVRPLKDTMTVTNTGSDTAFAILKKTPKIITFQGNATKVSGTQNVKVVYEGSANGGKTYIPIDTLSFGNVAGTTTAAKHYKGDTWAYTHFRARSYGVTGTMVTKVLLWITAKLEEYE